MDEPEQLALLKVGPWKRAKRLVEYVPPPPEVIEQYVHSVCMRLTQEKNADHRDTEFVRGLTNFMQVVVSIQTKHLNKGVKDVP